MVRGSLFCHKNITQEDFAHRIRARQPVRKGVLAAVPQVCNLEGTLDTSLCPIIRISLTFNIN